MDGFHSPFQVPQPGTVEPKMYMYIEDLAVLSVFFGKYSCSSIANFRLTHTAGAFVMLAFNTIRLLL